MKSKKNTKLTTQQDRDKQTSPGSTVDLAFGLFESEVLVLKGVLSLLFIFQLSCFDL